MDNSNKVLADTGESQIREIRSSDSHIYCKWKRGDIYDEVVKKINKEDYGKNVWDVAIIQEKKEVKWKHLLDDLEYENTWRYFIVCESSRWNYLYKKQIPSKVLPLFNDILDKATATWKYRTYDIIIYAR